MNDESHCHYEANPHYLDNTSGLSTEDWIYCKNYC
jgi:hypothetical protein